MVPSYFLTHNHMIHVSFFHQGKWQWCLLLSKKCSFKFNHLQMHEFAVIINFVRNWIKNRSHFQRICYLSHGIFEVNVVATTNWEYLIDAAIITHNVELDSSGLSLDVNTAHRFKSIDIYRLIWWCYSLSLKGSNVLLQINSYCQP